MDIPFRGRYDQATVHQAVALATRPAPWVTLLRWGLLIVYLPIFAYLAYPALFGAGTIDSARLARPLLVLITFLAFAVSPYLNTFRLQRGLWRQPSMQADRSGRITEKGIVYRAHDGDRLIEWDQIARRRQAPDLLVLVTVKGALSIFPRRFFGNDEAWGRFQQQVDQKVVTTK